MLYAGGYEKRYSLRGRPYYVWKKPVPRINDRLLDSVVYVYSSVRDAEEGVKVGGSGFLVCIPSEGYENPPTTFYIVTNSHVVKKAGSTPAIRLNTKDGSIDALETSEDDWVHHQDGDDLAICQIDVGWDAFKFSCMPPDVLLSQEKIQEHAIGPGDDVFMVGRFVDHAGHQRNTPSARFGNISMMPGEPVYNVDRKMPQVSFLVEMFSLGGFSGSPVFVHIPLFATRPGQDMPTQSSYGPWLLGVSWGHFRAYEKVVWKDDKAQAVDENWVVSSNSGQMGVVPAWKLQELLNQEEVVMARKHAENERRQRIANDPFVLDNRATEDEKSSDALTKDDFEDALDRVSRLEKKPDQAS